MDKQQVKEQEEGDFSNFRICKTTQENLKATKINYLFPIQVATFNAIYDKKDLIGKDRTGSGKTLAFCLPVLERMRKKGKYFTNKSGQRPLILVVVPTRELAIQVKREMERFRNDSREFRIQAFYGGTDIRNQIDALRYGVEAVIGTPGRLMDHIRRGTLSFKSLKVLILDETDQMLNIGFQEDIEFIIKSIEKEFEEHKRKRSKLQMVLFSATVPRWVDKVARKFMKEDLTYVDLVKDGYNKTSMTVEHLAMQVPSAHHKLKSISDLVMVYGGAHCRTIIFTDTKGRLAAYNPEIGYPGLKQVEYSEERHLRRETLSINHWNWARFRWKGAIGAGSADLRI